MGSGENFSLFWVWVKILVLGENFGLGENFSLFWVRVKILGRGENFRSG